MENDIEAPLSVRGLKKEYPGFRLGDISFDLREGMITGFIGRNGAGKTTTINAILNFIRPDGGRVTFRGADLNGDAGAVREKIGFVSAGMTYHTRKKLKTITDVTRSFYPDWDGAAYERAMSAFGLSGDKTPAELSNGMKIKYALALALSHGAELFILDEPTSGLDPVSREELTEIFLKLKDEGKTILFSTHITSDLEKCADRILFIRRGRLKADAALTDFRAGWRIAEVTGPVLPEMNDASAGICRTREGSTVLLPLKAAAEFTCREASLEEIMVHLEKEAEER